MGYSINTNKYISYFCMKCDKFVGKISSDMKQQRKYFTMKNHIDKHINKSEYPWNFKGTPDNPPLS